MWFDTNNKVLENCASKLNIEPLIDEKSKACCVVFVQQMLHH